MSQQTPQQSPPTPDDIAVTTHLTDNSSIAVEITLPIDCARTGIHYFSYSRSSCTEKMATAFKEGIEQADQATGKHDRVTAEVEYHTAAWAEYLANCLQEASTYGRTDEEIAQMNALQEIFADPRLGREQ